jgi:hypothetical protein
MRRLGVLLSITGFDVRGKGKGNYVVQIGVLEQLSSTLL